MFILTNIWMIGKKLTKRHYLKEKDFYSYLNMEDYTDADYAHAKRVCKDFEIKYLGKYYGLHVQSDTLLLGYVFEKFRNMRLAICKLDPAIIYFTSRISMASSFKKD